MLERPERLARTQIDLPAAPRTDRPQPGPARRDFLKLAGLGGVAASAAALGTAAAIEAPEEQTRERYRLSPHVERFYALHRL